MAVSTKTNNLPFHFTVVQFLISNHPYYADNLTLGLSLGTDQLVFCRMKQGFFSCSGERFFPWTSSRKWNGVLHL